MNVLQELLKSPKTTAQRFEDFKKNFAEKNLDPQTTVQEMLNSGKMSQEQFEMYRGVAEKFGFSL